MKTPDFTYAQIFAALQKLLGSAIGLAVAFGATLTDVQRVAIIATFEGTTTVLALIFVGGDAWIRGKRAENAAAIADAKIAIEVAAAGPARPPRPTTPSRPKRKS